MATVTVNDVLDGHVALDAPVRLDRSDALPSAPAHPRKLAALAEQWGLGGSVDRLVKALAG